MTGGFFERHPSTVTRIDSPEDWPKGVRGIDMGGLDLLGLDDQGRLYFDGERIATAGEIRLSKWQAWVAGITAGIATAATAMSAVLDLLRFLGGH